MEKSELGIRMEPDYFGPLWRYVRNDKITDIDYNGSQLWITDVENERYLIRNSGITDKFVEQFSHRIANEVSKPFNKKCNLLEAETDTLRISIVHESAALSGRSICIRKSMPQVRMQARRMTEEEYCSMPVLELLANCVAAKMNFVFCGEPGAGKTECAKFFSQFIPAQDRVITIEDNLEWHYSSINPGKDCVELRIGPDFDYTKAIKTCLRQNPSWIMLSEARSTEVKSLLECWSTGIRGFTTLHTDDVRKIPDRILNMMENRMDADRMENDVYSYVDVGILLRRKLREDGRIYRYMDQVCFFLREDQENMVHMQVMDGNLLVKELPDSLVKRMLRHGIRDPYHSQAVRAMVEHQADNRSGFRENRGFEERGRRP